MLPEAISEALGISLSEVLDLYFRDISDKQQDHLVWDTIDQRRMNVEDEVWLEGNLGGWIRWLRWCITGGMIRSRLSREV
jgi:hypothetical protein